MITERQQRELEYHRGHAEKKRAVLNAPISYDMLFTRRWWNAYWEMFAFLAGRELAGKKVLVLGCGTAIDALRIAKLGANVYGCDLSPDMLEIARALAEREGLTIHFAEMAAESLTYGDGFFDCVVAHDILHHADVQRALGEIKRVTVPGALIVVNEIYSHSWTDTIRRSFVVERFLYPLMKGYVYRGKPDYITEDERKLTEADVTQVSALLSAKTERHFNFLVTRIFPDRFPTLSKIDRILMILLKPFGRLLAGRILLAGVVSTEVGANT